MKRYTITITGLAMLVSSVDADTEEDALEDINELGYWHYCNELLWDDADFLVEEETDTPPTE